MRERLVELLNYVGDNVMLFPTDGFIGSLADYLLENGVIVPPCPIGTHLWRVTKPYRQEPKVTEFVVKNFHTVGKKHNIMLEVQAVNTPLTNIMHISAFKRTKEEAEKELNNL